MGNTQKCKEEKYAKINHSKTEECFLQESKKIYLFDIDDQDMSHCCICHKQFKRGETVNCSGVKIYCDRHGITSFEYSCDTVSQISEGFPCECSTTNKLCLSTDEFKKNLEDREILMDWIKMMIGDKEMKKLKNKEEIANSINEEMKRFFKTSGKHCIICTNLRIDIINLINNKI
jgi:hypothetical protein